MDSLTIREGSIQCKFDGTDGYHLVWGRWSPGIPQLRQDRRGNQPPYTDILEEWRIWVEGTVGETAQKKLDKLVGLFHQAMRWADSQGPTYVWIDYEMENSSLAGPLRAEVMGVPENFMDLPGDYDASGRLNRVGNADDPITIRFFHRPWNCPNELEQEVVAAAANPSKLTATFSNDLKASSPTRVTVNSIDPLAGVDGGYLILVRAANDVYISELEGGSGSGASQSDSANLARGGSVRRITGSTTAWQTVDISSITTFNTARRVAVFVAARVNNAARSWKIRVALKDTDAVTIGQTRVRVVNGADSTDPEIVFVGMAICSYRQINQIAVSVAVDDTTGSTTVDLDYVVLVNLDHYENRVITFGQKDVNRNGYADIEFDPKLNESPDPVVTYGGLPLPTRGDVYVAFSGASITAMVLATYSNYWCIVDGAGPSNETVGVTFNRTPVYLVPQ